MTVVLINITQAQALEDSMEKVSIATMFMILTPKGQLLLKRKKLKLGEALRIILIHISGELLDMGTNLFPLIHLAMSK